MSRNKAGTKSLKREKNIAFQKNLREQKRLRRQRRATHAAMEQATRMMRSKKKGTRDRDENLRQLGFVRVAASGPVEQKIQKIRNQEV